MGGNHGEFEECDQAMVMLWRLKLALWLGCDDHPRVVSYHCEFTVLVLYLHMGWGEWVGGRCGIVESEISACMGWQLWVLTVWIPADSRSLIPSEYLTFCLQVCAQLVWWLEQQCPLPGRQGVHQQDWSGQAQCEWLFDIWMRLHWWRFSPTMALF